MKDSYQKSCHPLLKKKKIMSFKRRVLSIQMFCYSFVESIGCLHIA